MRQLWALFFAINKLEALAQKGNQGLPWSEEEDVLLTQRFNEGIKITQLAKLHSRTYGAIKARLIKLQLISNNKTRQFLNCRVLDIILIRAACSHQQGKKHSYIN